MTRSRLGATVLLTATFVVGGFLGGTITRVMDHRARDAAHSERHRPGYVERLSDELQLTAEQRDRIQAVLDRHQPAMDSLWRQLRPQFESERQLIRQEIIALLTTEQKAKYAAIVQRQDSLRRAGQDRSHNGRP